MRPPDQHGPAADAWIINPDQFPAAPAFIGAWLILGAPVAAEQMPKLPPGVPMPTPKCGFHVLWDTWMIQACHLREVEGVDPPKLHYPEAEFEIDIVAMHPDQCPIDPDKIAGRGLTYLQPLDLVKQIHGVTDDQVKRLLGLMVREICAGRMSPDQDFRSAWGRVIDHTVAHYRAGMHDQE